jgi:iron(III) transport system substrate-binding protein
MHREKNRPIYFLCFALILILVLMATSVFAQDSTKIPASKGEIVSNAKKEGKLILSPGYDKKTIAALVKAYNKHYPFVDVSWSYVSGVTAAQRQLFEMAAGKAALDLFSPSSDNLGDYLKQNVYKKYDFRKIAQGGVLKIMPEMIDESGLFVWLGSNVGVLAYNSKLVPANKAPSNWESCLDPQWKGKIAVDTRPNTLSWLVPAWGEEKVLDFARKLKENEPLWVRGQTAHMPRLAAGEYPIHCSMYLHTAQRTLLGDPTLPVKVVVPNPVPITSHEPEGVYVGAKNPNAALLWIEFVASNEAQQIVDSIDPGKASFLLEGTVGQKLLKGKSVSLCGGSCRDRQSEYMERIAVTAWGLPKLGEDPKK